MSKKEVYRIEIPIETTDDYSEGLKNAEKAVEDLNKKVDGLEKTIQEFGKTAEKTDKAVDDFGDSSKDATKKVDDLEKSVSTTDKEVDNLGGSAKGTKKEVQDLGDSAKGTKKDVDGLKDSSESAAKGVDKVGESASGSEANVTKFQGAVRKTKTRLREISGNKWQLTVRAVDRASRVIRSIGSFASRFASRTYRITVRALDMATRPIRRLVSSVSSILGTLGLVGGIAGGVVIPLRITMDRQNTQTGFEVLLGSEEAAKDRMDELIGFAGQTPYKRDEIFQASRTLEVFTDGALATGDGLRQVGDIAAGTQQEFGDVALWMGRLYDAMGSGRPIGEMTSRLQEMGAISGSARARLEDLADSGGDIKTLWPQVTKEFERYDGMMDKLSDNLANLLLGTRTFFSENISARWGAGIEKALSPALSKFRDWRKENAEAIRSMGDAIESYGQKFTQGLIDRVGSAFSYIDTLFFSDKYSDLSFGAKIKVMIDDANNAFSDWWDNTGRDQVTGLSGRMGTAFGEVINGAIMGILGIGSEGESTFVSAGFEAGSSFVSGFLDGLDAGQLASAIGGKIKDINVRGATDPFKGEGFGSTAGAVVVDLLLLGTLAKVLKPLSLLKGPAKAIGNTSKRGWGWLTRRGSKGGGDPNIIPPGGGDPPNRPPASGGRRGGGGGSWFGGWFGRNKPPNTPPNSSSSPSGSANPVILDRYGKPLPPSGTASPSSPSSATRGSRIPRGLSKVFGLGRRIPVIGSLLGGLALATAPKEDKAGVAGSIAGGYGGAATGAAIGTAIAPGPGTVIGGLIGGIAGSMGGHAIGDWFSDNWTSIKQGAQDAGAWVADAWDATLTGIKDFGSDVAKWTSESFGEAMDWISGKWGTFSDWFGKTVWTPLSDAAINTMNFAVGAFVQGLDLIQAGWSIASEWFMDTVWEPIKVGAETLGGWIVGGLTWAKETVQEGWNSFSEWFSESVWEPVKAGASAAGEWISEKYTAAKEWVSEKWAPIGEWFSESVWTPIKEGATAAGEWIGERYDDAKAWVEDSWSSFSDWFSETVWTPLEDAAEATGKWISDRFDDAVTLAKDAWDGISGWFDENVWAPLESGAQSAWNWIKGKWNDATTWAGDITKRGEEVTGVTTSSGQLKSTSNSLRNTGVGGALGRVKQPPGYADGGFINRPHLGLVGEAGPEMIIPLSSGRRSRALDLYNKTGQMLGIQPSSGGSNVVDMRQWVKERNPAASVAKYANGGLVGGNEGSNVVNYPSRHTTLQLNNSKYADGKRVIDFEPATETTSPAITYGDTHVQVTVNVEGAELEDAKALAERIGDEVAGVIARKMKEASDNMPVAQ